MIVTIPDTASVAFGSRRIGPGEPVLVIAEIGINHEGDVEQCARMVEAAIAVGADAIKLQTIDAERNYAPDTESYRIFKGAELSREETALMFELTRSLGAEPFTTAGDFATLEWIEKLDPPGHKISSGLLSCTPIIERAAYKGRTLLMSTGMADIADIDNAIAAARAGGAGGIGLFQCTSLYPAPLETLHLAVIASLHERYRIPVGFSDHSAGVESPALAVAAGAVMIEKHFSLDKSRAGFDHRLSLEPDEFREMTQAIRRAELARGEAKKALTPETHAVRQRMKRYLGAAVSIKKQDLLGENNLGFFRLANPGDALPASAFDEVSGTRATQDIKQFTPIIGGLYARG